MVGHKFGEFAPTRTFFGHTADRKAKRALQTLLHPEMLGRTFQVLALAKNVDASASPLSGFKFAGEARSALGL